MSVIERVAPGPVPVAVADDRALQALAARALSAARAELRQHRGRLQPFLLWPGGSPEYLFGVAAMHPVERAVRHLVTGCAGSTAPVLALVLEARLPLPAGGSGRALLAIACERGRADGEAWAEAWPARRWFGGAAPSPPCWRVGPALNLFDAAAAA